MAQAIYRRVAAHAPEMRRLYERLRRRPA